MPDTMTEDAVCRMQTLYWRWLYIPLLLFFLICSWPVLAVGGESKFGVGALTLGGYIDIQYLYQPDTKRPWVYGLRYWSGTERFDDPFTGNPLSDDEETLYGMTVLYLFKPGMPASLYAGAGVYRHSLTVTSLVTGESSTDSVIAPFIGGGYMGRLGKTYYYNIGIMLGLSRAVKTQTSVTEDEKSSFDPQLIVGISF